MKLLTSFYREGGQNWYKQSSLKMAEYSRIASDFKISFKLVTLTYVTKNFQSDCKSHHQILLIRTELSP